MAQKYLYKNITSLQKSDDRNVVIQGRIQYINDLPKDYGFCIKITDDEAINSEPNGIQCCFWRSTNKRYRKNMFRIGEVYDIINPEIKLANPHYHKHSYQINITEDTKWIKKKYLSTTKSGLICIKNAVKSKRKKKNESKDAVSSHQTSIINWLKKG